VPPTESNAKAKAELTYDGSTKTLRWTISYWGLTGSVTAAHFHGPATKGENAGVMITISPLPSPMKGAAILTEDQSTRGFAMTQSHPCAAVPFFLFVVMLLLPCSILSAAQVRGFAKACASDVKTQCAGVNPGSDRIRECVKMHFKDLSEACQNFLLRSVTVRACADDAKKYCADTQTGGGRLEACMKAHVSDFSESCKEALGSAAGGNN